MPAGLSKRDERILVRRKSDACCGSAACPFSVELMRETTQRSVRRRAHYLDKGFSICGFRFGWTAILGLIPYAPPASQIQRVGSDLTHVRCSGAGDIAQFLLGYSLVLRKCRDAE